MEPVEVQSGDVTLRGDRRGHPEGPTVLLLHGGGQTRHSWSPTATELVRAGFDVVNLDLRGHGDSDWAADGDYSIDAFARDVAASARWAGVPVMVVGASMGGLAAMVAAGERSAAVSALVLVDVTPQLEETGVARIHAFMSAAPSGFGTLEEAAEAIAAYRGRARPVDVTGLRKNLRRGRDGRWRWHWDPRFLTGDRSPGARRDPARLEAAAAGLGVPTLLVRGRSSDMVSEAAARRFLGLVPHAEFVDVSGAGHMVVGDRNDAFGDAVVDFLLRREDEGHRRTVG